jgi:hypothetical protein
MVDVDMENFAQKFFFDTFSCLVHCFLEKCPDEKYIIRKKRDKTY